MPAWVGPRLIEYQDGENTTQNRKLIIIIIMKLMVTHPSTNQAWCRVTTTNVLAIHQTAIWMKVAGKVKL